MSRSEAALLPLAESIADGSVVDWDAVEAGASPDEQTVIRQLRILSSLAGLHRSLSDPQDSPFASAARRSATAPAIGSWAHLALVERLGGGTFGDVYRAWDRELERDVALKLLRADESLDDLRASRIAMEGRLLARVRHANVVTVHGVAVHERRVGLWMELVRGATLEQQLAAHGTFSAREAALVGIDLCRALAAIHAAGLIHRDVKAQNVMREDGGRIVLMDLGTGREADPGGIARAVPDLAGTPLYLAPEIFTGAAASERTDLYSLGVLLYHLVTGSFPVRATKIEELQEGHRRGRGVRLRDARADLPTAFVKVVDRAIANDSSKRYASAGALEADLAQALDDTAITAVANRTEKRPVVRAWSRAGILVATIAAMLALAVVGWPTLRGRFGPALAPGTIQSIAVLPLVNLSGDPSQEYFADGMTDELIGKLGRLESVRVISRTSAMQFKGAKKTAPEIAKALKVDAVLEGSVRLLDAATSGGGRRVRINARLIYAGTDTQLWDRTFESVVSDVLTLQSDVASAVADGIESRLSARQRESLTASRGRTQTNRQVNPQAYEAYLRGRYLSNNRTPADLRNAIDRFREAVDADPTSALAWAGLADGYQLLATYDLEAPRQAWPRAKAAVSRALELDDSSAEAHTSLAMIAWMYEWNLPEAQKEFNRGIALNPNYAMAHTWYGLFLNEMGRFDQALVEMKRAQVLDPLSRVNEVNVGRSYYFARQHDRALDVLRQLAQREPDYWIVHAILGQVHLAQNHVNEAIQELERARQLSPSTVRNLGVLGDAYGRAGRRAEARKLADELSRLSHTQYVSPVYSAMIAMGLGDRRRALDLVERAFADRSDWVMMLHVEPQFDALRAEPRFREILRRADAAPLP